MKGSKELKRERERDRERKKEKEEEKQKESYRLGAGMEAKSNIASMKTPQNLHTTFKTLTNDVIIVDREKGNIVTPQGREGNDYPGAVNNTVEKSDDDEKLNVVASGERDGCEVIKRKEVASALKVGSSKTNFTPENLTGKRERSSPLIDAPNARRRMSSPSYLKHQLGDGDDDEDEEEEDQEASMSTLVKKTKGGDELETLSDIEHNDNVDDKDEASNDLGKEDNEEQVVNKLDWSALKEDQERMEERNEDVDDENMEVMVNRRLMEDEVDEVNEVGERTKEKEISLDERISRAVSEAMKPLVIEITRLSDIIDLMNSKLIQPHLKTAKNNQWPNIGDDVDRERTLSTSNQRPLSYSQASSANIDQAIIDQANSQLLKVSNTKKSTAARKLDAALGLARKCQGFSPINRKMIDDQMEKMVGEASEAKFQKAGTSCLTEFLSKDMAMGEEEVANLQIRGVFFPPMGKRNDILNVEFWREEDVRQIQRHAKNLPNGDSYKASILNYIPKDLSKVYREVEEQAFQLRTKGPKKCHTRIWIRKEVELRVREDGDATPWAKISPTLLTNQHP